MKTNLKIKFSHILMITLVVALMFAVTGAQPYQAADNQASYIVQASTTDLAASLVTKAGGQITSRLDIIQAVAANLTEKAVAGLRLEKGIVGITLNGLIQSSDNAQSGEGSAIASQNQSDVATDYPDLTGANLAWAKNVTGDGITVAVLDTGVTLMSQFNDGNTKKSRIVAWKDYIDKSKNPIDPNGHGTHVAGIIANGQQGANGEYNGMAPDANIAAVRVLDSTGAGTYETVINGLQWVIQHKNDYNIRIVNMSLVSPAVAPYWADPLDQAVTAAWANGLVVITAAGNSGPTPMSISVPGNNPYAITVGAFTDNYTPDDWGDDYIPDFSAAGPTLDGFAKPDLVAPGGHIVSLVPQNSYLYNQYPDNRVGTDYFRLAGTSQATAIVSGIAALALSKNPSLSNDQLKMRLTATALPWVNSSSSPAVSSIWQQGAGRVNAYDAVFAKTSERANNGMNAQSDLSGGKHYAGYSYYDKKTDSFRMYAPYDNWDNGYSTWSSSHGSWSGSHGSWSGSHGSWSGDFGSWSGSHGSWSGSHGSWSGSHGSWSGDFQSWAGSHGSWSGGYTSWAGSHGSWSGTEPWAGSQLANSAFLQSFAAGVSPSTTTSSATISIYLLDQ